MYEALVGAVAVLAGAVASVAGFGIGSLLTPVLSLSLGVKLAVALIAVPHFAGTGLRLWRLRAHVDRGVLLGFGVASAAGGLVGALFHSRAGSPTLALIFGLLLLLAGTSELTGLARRVELRGAAAWAAGALSGLFGGMVGNQGGIRSAALLGFHLPRHAFVATATAIAIVVDMARMPVYFATEGAAILREWPLLLITVTGVVAGTLLGERLLSRIPERVFRTVVAILILALGVYMLTRGL
ncbi:MAG TPA: sulfite exporter TauE/SafE family protein [Longimicrobiales bacterium]|nr:sulfite exporter TauE/SafE family protein [Longimicrobiales bacterium]